jgi:uncharacterized protein (DUF488 family)
MIVMRPSGIAGGDDVQERSGNMDVPLPVYTIGHSTRSAQELVRILERYRVRVVADVRTFPFSRRNPQFSRETISESLHAAGIRYVHCRGLGGLRKPLIPEESRNRGWHDNSFRGYADYMQSGEFSIHLDRLVELALAGPVAIMCAEADPSHCHRSLIADALMIRGIGVIHLLTCESAIPHMLTPFAVIRNGFLSYPS